MKFRCLVMGLLLVTGTVRPISYETAYIGAGVTSLGFGGITYKMTSGNLRYIAIPFAVLGGFLGYKFLYQFTPAGRIERAEDMLKGIRYYRLVKEGSGNEERLLRLVQDEYVSASWPLISAFNDLTYYINILVDVIDLADCAQEEDRKLTARAEKLKADAHFFYDNIKTAIKIIRTNKEYLAQLEQYKEEQRHREQLQVQQSIANAQWSNAQAQHEIAEAQKEANKIEREAASRPHHTTQTYTVVTPVDYSPSHAPSQVPQSSSSPKTSVNTAGTMSETEARDYVAQIVASFEYALKAQVNYSDLTYLKQFIQQSVQSAQYAYQKSSSFVSAGKRYKKDVVDQFIGAAVLEYIEKTSYQYAYDHTYDTALATRIAESMRNNALALLVQNNVLNCERIALFVGAALEKAVNDKIKQWSPSFPEKQTVTKPDVKPVVKPVDKPVTKPVQSSQAVKLYPSDACCVCLDDFGGDVGRVYLKPCGHDMCKNCAYDWFFGVTQKKECPQCRAAVSLDQLQEDII
jgi:hypothetical protein